MNSILSHAVKHNISALDSVRQEAEMLISEIVENKILAYIMLAKRLNRPAKTSYMRDLLHYGCSIDRLTSVLEGILQRKDIIYMRDETLRIICDMHSEDYDIDDDISIL